MAKKARISLRTTVTLHDFVTVWDWLNKAYGVKFKREKVLPQLIKAIVQIASEHDAILKPTTDEEIADFFHSHGANLPNEGFAHLTDTQLLNMVKVGREIREVTGDCPSADGAERELATRGAHKVWGPQS